MRLRSFASIKNLNAKQMTENDLSRIIVNTCYKIHLQLGPGLLESVYETILCYELIEMGLKVERQKTLPVIWEDIKMDIGFQGRFNN